MKNEKKQQTYATKGTDHNIKSRHTQKHIHSNTSEEKKEIDQRITIIQSQLQSHRIQTKQATTPTYTTQSRRKQIRQLHTDNTYAHSNIQQLLTSAQ